MTEQQERLANEIRNTLNTFSENVNKILSEMFSFESKTEKDWEMKCPYEVGDEYWIICDSGEFEKVIWNDYNLDKEVFIAGNAFLTREAAELEAKRRNLLTRFRAFSDERNGDWKPNWRKNDAKYYFYISSTDGEIGINDIYFYETFPLFGYFKNEKDAERAIELFGDEIKKLFIDCECD